MNGIQILELMATLFMIGIAGAGHILFISFVRHVASHFRNFSLDESAFIYLGFHLSFLTIMVMLAGIAYLGPRGSDTLTGCLSLLLFPLGIFPLVWSITMLGELRKTVAMALRRAGY